VVIPNGIRPDDLYFHLTPDELRCKLEKVLDMRLHGKKILLTVGRLIKRKGVAWFVDSVIPELDDSYLYLIAGHGPEFESINRKVEERGLQGRVRMLGRVSEKVRRLIYNAADIFIMPNITVEGDVEGFGIVAIEAGSYGLPVVAGNLQGLKDAIIDKETGYLVEERNTREFLDRIRSMDLRKKDIRRLVNTRFHWSEIYKQYQTALLQL
jgi:glycosyltransferase involved in cell wall biosynthesis